MDAELSHEHRGDDHVLMVSGEIDMGCYQKLAAELHVISTDGRPRAIVDMSKVTFMDSSGLRALIQARESASGPEFVIKSPSDAVLRVLRLTRLEDVFTIEY